ncbi:Thioredoxin, putative [Leishmania lindenbergi]|uniref:Thioredoxin n=1 Tax=Leishmania lindenbergi TaxID=651832 RepID=A0AAW2ZVU8_9TRYP
MNPAMHCAPWRTLLLVLAILSATLCLSHAWAAEDVNEHTSETLELIFEGSTTTYKLPDSIVVLNNANFEPYLFPSKHATPRAFLVLCYSPWCSHCKALLPQFLNATLQLDLMRVPHSTFAVVDVQKNTAVSEYFNVERFPTLLYTTGKDRQWHLYEGSNTQEGFMQFSAYLQHAVDNGSFSEDVTDVVRFNEVEESSGTTRVPCYVYVPATSTSTPENQRTASWSHAVDGAASVSNIRFAVIYEKSQAEGWVEHAGEKYKKVVEKAKACVAARKAGGPEGEALVVFSDRYRAPRCYSGPWVEKRSVAKTSKSRTGQTAGDTMAMSTSLENFLALHGFHAVEDASSAMFATLEHYPKNYLGVVMTNRPINDKDTEYVPVLREIAQAANDALEKEHGRDLSIEEEMRIPRVSWSYIDVVEYEMWRSRYDVELDQLPAVMIIDTKRDRFFKMRTRVPRFEAIKLNTPWRIGGEQHQLIAQFAQDVLADVYKAQKLSVAGAVAEYLSHYPGFAFLYETLNYEDFVFDVVVMALGFFSFLLFLGIVMEPLMEWHDGRSKKEAHKAKRD